jgi:hypothetical protein
MKVYGGVDVLLHTLLTLGLDGGTWKLHPSVAIPLRMALKCVSFIYDIFLLDIE